jgi:ubiquinone/menaquinone biosynthesis C-methylase UbiE
MKHFTRIIIVILLPFIGIAQYEQSDWNERDEWMPVQRILDLAEIQEGSHVADIGCHEGYLSIHLANKVGDEGRVYAVDVRDDRLDRLKEHLKKRELSNVSVILGDYDNPKLPQEKLDVIIIMDTYHEMTDYKEILEHVYKALKPGGKLVILEKLKKRVKNASRDKQTDAHTISSKYVKKEMKAAHFVITKELYDLGDWQNDEDKPMWLVVGAKEEESKWRSRRL